MVTFDSCLKLCIALWVKNSKDLHFGLFTFFYLTAEKLKLVDKLIYNVTIYGYIHIHVYCFEQVNLMNYKI